MDGHTPKTSDAQRLLELQRAAHRREGPPNARVRIDRLDRLDDMVRKRSESFADAISADFGNRSRFETALLETMVTLSAIRYARKNVRWWMEPAYQEVDLTFWPGSAWIRREPLGVIGVVSPWNYPLQLALSPLVDIIAGGNRAIIKPSEQTPNFSDLLHRAVSETFAEEEVGVVTGGPEVASEFTRLPFDHLVFTGSTSIGRKVAQAAADGLVPTTLELGGKSPVVICPSGSMTKAVKAIAYGKFINAGQTCIAPDYVMAPRERMIELAEQVLAEARRSYPDVGGDYSSMISERAFDRMTAAIAEAEQGGAKILRHPAPADRSKRLLPPIVVLDAPENCMLMREEIFGPVLPIVGYDTLDDALEWINSHPHPLALYIFAEDRKEQTKVLDRTQSGGVTVNGTLLHIAQEGLPFGGVGASGMGAYHGRAGFDRFTHARAVFKTGFFNAASWLAPPYGKRAKRLLKFLMR
ncbi:MAG TPA: coniferyl aldehyde dehydrogenase [Hyphomonadaceae bacterium]|nr:coniferyl aldehyde dehydrogenase [Hyphomonadaceae bacterium]HPI47219.1 coniferyl aldehyde dehydrogenase [Hyphomonadaceae bacterium]